MNTEPRDRLEDVWEATSRYDGVGTRGFEWPAGTARLYKGAMEIPLVAIFVKRPAVLDGARLKELEAALQPMGLELDCVEEGANYKINRSDTKLYLGRVTQEALKLHAPRITELGRDAFFRIVQCYLGARDPAAGPAA